MKSRDQLTCTNCRDPLNGQRQVFQGVVICENCFKMVSHTVQRTQQELRMLFLVYTDMIRVGLIKGEFRPPVLPAPGAKLPHSELAKALREMAKRGVEDARESDSSMPEVQGNQDRSNGEVRSG